MKIRRKCMEWVSKQLGHYRDASFLAQFGGQQLVLLILLQAPLFVSSFKYQQSGAT